VTSRARNHASGPYPPSVAIARLAAPRLEGRLVTLELLTEDHFEPLWRAARADPDVWNWMPVRAGDSREQFTRWFEWSFGASADPRIPFVTKVAGEVAGSTSYTTLRLEQRAVEIGNTWLARCFWGSGANVEAKYLMLRHAFDVARCVRVEFKTEASNDRSRAALSALPARFEGIHRKHMFVRGSVWRDSAWYSVIDDEWPSVRAALERKLGHLLAAAPTVTRSSDPIFDVHTPRRRQVDID
jgi:RimJ/RimL family protein N-acetyltransferase